MTELRGHAVEDLLLPPTMDGRLAHLRDEGLADGEGLGWILDRVGELVHNDLQAAEELADLCEAASSGLELPSVRARARYLRARVLAERGDLDDALALIAAARGDWLAGGEALAALRTDLGRMQILDDQGRHELAAEIGEELLRALDELQPEGSDDRALAIWLRAAGQENLGVAWGFTGQHERALLAYANAEATYRELDSVEDTARPMANRGIELLSLGRAREALDALCAAADTFAAAGDRLWSAKCLGHVAQAHHQLGELVPALRVLDDARATLDELGATAEQERLRLMIAAAYLDVGLFAEASAEAVAAAERTAAAGMHHDTAQAHYTAAMAYLAAGDVSQASANLREAAELFDRVGDLLYRARCKLLEVDVLAAYGRHDEAAAAADIAAAQLRGGGWLAPLAWAMLRQSDLADDEQATVLLAEAGALCATLRLPLLRYQHALRQARLYRRAGRVAAAEAVLRRAAADVEQLVDTLPDHALRTGFRSDKLAAHDGLVDLLVARGGAGDAREACRIADTAKAQTLAELVAGTVGAPPRAGNQDPELHTLLADLNATYVALHDTAAEPSRLALVRLRADDLERRITATRLRLAVTNPTSVPPQDQQASVAADPAAATTVAFHVTGADVIAFVVTGGPDGAVQARRLSGAAAVVDTQLERLASQWSRFQLGAGFLRRHHQALEQTARTILGALYDVLLRPLEDALTPRGAERLVIVPHRQLGNVPFHALHDGERYLVEYATISVASSMTGPAEPSRAGGCALVLAVPDAHAPAMVSEAAAVADLLPDARVLVGDAATGAALASALPGPRIVHIACHGLYRQTNPLFSSLRLADRWITSGEILGLDFTGSLVTLSACESGRQGGTAEPVGLAWAFLAAGAAGVVVSRWMVHDDVTGRLMAQMYRHLCAGEPPEGALRLAQRSTAAEHPHPFYWAPFTFVQSHATTNRGI